MDWLTSPRASVLVSTATPERSTSTRLPNRFWISAGSASWRSSPGVATPVTVTVDSVQVTSPTDNPEVSAESGPKTASAAAASSTAERRLGPCPRSG